jgi:RNA polymerase sigma-70 factor (ECF subfamily)
MHDLAPRPSEILAQKAEHRVLLEGLRRIPVEHQVLLELYFFEPLPAPEIAAILGVPIGTVRTRLRRAKELLEAQIAEVAANKDELRSTLADLDGWARAIRERLGR